MSDREQIIETITRLSWLTDHHRWEELSGLFAESVRMDYTSLLGGQPETARAVDIVAGWKSTLGALDAHQHLVANHLATIAGNHAEATAAFQATHQYDDETWTLGGDYTFQLIRRNEGWAISGMTMTAVWQTGDAALVGRAGEAQRR